MREQRQRRHLMQADVELATGVSIAKIRAMEKGSNPRLDDLLAVVSYIGIPLNQAVRHPRRINPWIHDGVVR